MGVDDAAQAREGPVQGQMGVRVAGGLASPLHPLPVAQADDHHILRAHVLVLHPRGLDDHQPALPVNAGHVAPGEGDKAVPGQEEIRLADRSFQFFQHTALLTSASRPDRTGTDRAPGSPPWCPL